MTNAQQLEDVLGAYKMTPTNTQFYYVPEFCGQCRAPMVVKQGWKITGYDTKTGEPDKYEALVFCSRHKWWRTSYHDRRALIFTPKEHAVWGGKKHGLSVLTIITKGI